MSDAKALAMRLAKETARRFGQESLRPLARQRGSADGVTERTCRAFAELGLGRAHVPEAAGGVGLGPLAAALVAEALAAGDVNAAFALPQPGPFVDVVGVLGNHHQKKIWLHPFYDAPENTFGALVVGPPGSIRSKPAGEYLLVSGAVSAVWQADRADRLVVVADAIDGDGLPLPERRAFVLARGHEGLFVHPPTRAVGLPFAACAPVRLHEVRVPKSQWLGPGDAASSLRQAFTLQAVRMGSLALGAARAASSYMVELVEQRRQAGRPSAHFHSMGFLLVDMHLACEAAFNRLRKAAATTGPEETEVAAARAAADEVAFFVTESAQQMLVDGGEAAEAHPIAGWHEDVKMLARSYRADAYFAPAMQAATPDGAPDFLC